MRGPKIRVEFPIRQVGRFNYVPCGCRLFCERFPDPAAIKSPLHPNEISPSNFLTELAARVLWSGSHSSTPDWDRPFPVGEVVVVGLAKGTVWDTGSATIEPRTVADQFWEIYSTHQSRIVTVS